VRRVRHISFENRRHDPATGAGSTVAGTISMMQASIPTVELVNDHHHVYHVHVHYQPAGTTWVARHRYSEFYELHSSSGMPSTDTEFPPKLWFGNRDEGAVAERQKKLELWLRAAVSATGCYDVPAANRDASQRTAVALLDPFLQVDDQRLGLSSGPPSTPGVMAPSAFEPLLVGAPPQIAAAAKAAQNLAVGRGSVNEFISELSALKTLVENQSVQLDQMRLSLSSPQPSSPAGLLPPMHQTPSAADAAATDPVAGAAEAPAGANGPDSVVEKHLANHADELKALLQGPAAAAAASAHIEEHRSDVAAANRAPRIGILGSTRGTNTLHIYDEIAAGRFNAQVAVVISNISKAQILERARAADVPAVHIAAKGRSREEFDAEVNSVLASHGVDIVLLVGFMRILSPVFCNAWKGRAVNVHPSLLPKHAALMDLEVHQSVLDAGDTESGCTVHMVDEVVDAGSIVLQPSVSVSGDDTAETLKSKVQALEAPALVEAVKIFAQNGMSFVKPASAAAAAATAEQPDKQQQVATEVLALGALQTREQYKQQQQEEAQSDEPWQNTTK
jgi:phosphoribosylglycinamide formyltransferase-1